MDYCPHCAKPLDIVVPVEPMFTLDTVAQIIPMTLDGLRGWLKKHKAELSEPVYARKGWGPRVSLIRLLTASEVRMIRQDQIRPRAGWWRRHPG